MDRNEYLNKLNYEIGNMSAEQKEEIIAIFNEHFELGMLDGRSEEDICRDLGSPAFVAAQFLENNRERLQGIPISMPPDNTAPAPQARRYANTRQDFEHTHDPANINIKREFNAAAEGITKINVNMLASDIRVLTGNEQDESISVTIFGRTKNSDFNIFTSNGILNIIENKKFVLFSLFNIRTVHTEITIPHGFNGSLYIKDSAGNVGLEELSLAKTEVKATAGDVKVNNHIGDIELYSTAGNANLNNVCGKMNLRSTAGDIKIENCNGSIEAHTSAGNLKIATKKGNISASTSAGNVKIAADEILKLKATSSAGNVKIEAHKLSGDAELSSSAGNVKLELRQVAGSITARSSLGNVTVTLPRDASMRITPKTHGKCKSDFINNPDSPYTLDIGASLGSASIRSF